MPSKDVEVDTILSIEGGVKSTYLAVATRWSASFIKVSRQMRSDEFKRMLG